ncbi:MAG: serine hydrolase, partial [Bacteroidota bacterium]
GIPGVSVAVINNGVIEWAKGYGMADRAENRKVTAETMFQAGSISKPVAATRALQLWEAGLISLDSNVNNYLSSWKVPDNEFTIKEKVTLRRILDHSAGLTVWGFPGYPRGDTVSVPSVPEILNGMGNTDSVLVYKEPGESWRYSGGGYTIMQLMITDIEQKTFPEIMQEKVLNPLGMNASTYLNPLPEKYHSMAATGYHNDGTEVKGKWHIYPEMAAAGLWTTPSQLVQWANEIQEIAQKQKDGLLKKETVKEMLTLSTADYGLGITVGEHTFGHGGADEGFRALLTGWLEHPIAVVIMGNSNNGNIIREIMLSIAKEYDLPGITPQLRTVNEQTPEQLKRFAGKYNFPSYGTSDLVVKDNGLEFSGEVFSSTVFLLPENDSTFFNQKTGTYYTFQLEEDAVVGVQFSNVKGEKTE